MPTQTLLLPLYETLEEYVDEDEDDSSTHSSEDSSSLTSVIIETKEDLPPQSTQPIPPPSDKKHVKFVEVITGDFNKLSAWRPGHYPGRFPHRTPYGAINLPSAFRCPSKAASYKMGKGDHMYNFSYGTHSAHTNTRKLRKRIRLKGGYTCGRSKRLQLSPIAWLFASIVALLLLFLWFLSGGDCHRHNHKAYDLGENPGEPID